jgi:hypothetical protein
MAVAQGITFAKRKSSLVQPQFQNVCCSTVGWGALALALAPLVSKLRRKKLQA